MKRKWCALMLAFALTTSLVACSKNTQTQNPQQGSESNLNETTNKSDILGGVYSGGDKLVEIPFGSIVDGKPIDIFSIKAAENYWCGVFYHDLNDKEQTVEYANGNDELKKAIEKGLLQLDGKINNIALYSTDGSSTTIVYNYLPYSEEENYELWKNSSKDYTIIKDDKHEAFYYTSQDGKYVVLICDLGELGSIQANFNGKMIDKIGADKIGQSLYDLITFK